MSNEITHKVLQKSHVSFVIKAKERIEYLEKCQFTDQEQIINERKNREDKIPLSPEKWIGNEYFCGHLARDMYDKLKEEFVDVYTRNVFEVVMGGAIGYGKTTFCLALQVYSMYLLTCYGLPQKEFRGMVESASILYMNLNTKESKAKDSYFIHLNKLLKSIPYFQNDVVLHPNLINEIRIDKKGILAKFSGATKTAAESEHLIFCVMDEVNLYDVIKKSVRSDRGASVYDAAEIIYNSAIRRMTSRYMLPDGTMPLPSLIISLCKETYPDSFINRRIKKIKKQDLEKRNKAKIIKYAEWETKPPGTYEKKYFYIKTGTRTESPKILLTKDDVKKERLLLSNININDYDSLFEIIRVPIAGGEYVVQAKNDLSNFIRDMCGRSTEALNTFFEKKEPIFNAIRKGVDNTSSHPFTGTSTTFFDGVSLIKDRLCSSQLVLDDQGNVLVRNGENVVKWSPHIQPNAFRFIHIDPGLTNDAAGFAMGCINGWSDILRTNVEGITDIEKAPNIWIDVVLEILPPHQGEIPFDAIRSLIYTFRKMGFKIKMVTLDTWQSRDFIQQLNNKDIDAGILSVDRTIGPYIKLKKAYYENRISVYEYLILESQLSMLERVYTGQIKDGRPIEKIDHPPGEAKDVSDALAGVVESIENYASEMTFSGIIKKRCGENIINKEVQKHDLFKSGNYEKMFDIMNGDDLES